MVGSAPSFSDRLAAATAATDSLLCLGLDPDGDSAAEAERQCHQLVEATSEFICAVKPNLAFFEQHGSAGYAVLERLRVEVPAGCLVIMDGKRGDIGSTALAYARAMFDVLGADAVTVNPLLGGDSVAPFLQRPGRCVLVLTRTSNPGAADFMEQPTGGDGRPLYERIVDEAVTWPAAATVGFVVGATAAHAVAAVRGRAPTAPLLLPGLGAQGGQLRESVLAGLNADGGGAIFPVSRGISHDPSGPAAAARRFRDDINAARRGA